MRWILRTAPLLLAFWLVLSAHVDPLFLFLGALSVGLVCWLSWRAGLADEMVTLALVRRLPWYFPWLGKEVLLASISVGRKVWSPRPALRPAVESTQAGEMSLLSQVIYANSITLTPGTLALAVDDGHVEVHSLEAGGLEKLHEGRMLRRVRRLEPRR